MRRAQAVHPICDLQIEYSLASRGIEAQILPVCRELGIGITAYGVLSRGLISGHCLGSARRGRRGFVKPARGFRVRTWRRISRWWSSCGAVAKEIGASVAQVAIAWVVAQGKDIVPLIGAKRREQLTESLGASGCEPHCCSGGGACAGYAGGGGGGGAVYGFADGAVG